MTRGEALRSSWPGSGPAIHVFPFREECVDARNECAHDEGERRMTMQSPPESALEATETGFSCR